MKVLFLLMLLWLIIGCSGDEGGDLTAGAVLDVAEAGITQLDVIEPASVQPDVIQPDVIQSDVAQADVAQADVAQADVAQADVAQADVVQANVVQAGAGQADTVIDKPETPLATATGGSGLAQLSVFNDDTAAYFVPDAPPLSSTSLFRPTPFSVPSTINVPQNSKVRIELGYGINSPLQFLHLWSKEDAGYFSLALSTPAGNQLTQAVSMLIEPHFEDAKESVCYQLMAEDSKGFLSDASEFCFNQSVRSDDDRVFRYFDRHFAGGSPTSFLETYSVDSGNLATSNLGTTPYQSLVEVKGKSFVTAADRLLLIDPVSGETQSVLPLVVQASTSMGTDGESVFLVDHLGDIYRINADTHEATHVSRIHWSILSIGDLVYLPDSDLMLSTVRFRETDNDYLFSINRITGEYSIIGITGAQAICELILERSQLLGLGCDGTLLLIDPASGETAEISPTPSQVGLGYHVTSEIKTHYWASDLKFPGRGVDWRYWGGSVFHLQVYHSNMGFDDSHAYDVSKDGDVEANIAITPVAPGDVVSSLERIGFVLVKHFGSLVLDDGSEYPDWYSGYMHLSDFTGPINGVSNDYVLGYLSDTGTSNKHLHFAVYVYRIVGGQRTLSAVDIATQLKALSLPIVQWIDGCSWPDKTFKFDQPWWTYGQQPCKT